MGKKKKGELSSAKDREGPPRVLQKGVKATLSFQGSAGNLPEIGKKGGGKKKKANHQRIL